jgi:hypothetical protein
MATKKITDLVELISAASGDVLPIVDISDDITKKIQVSNFPISTAAQTAIDAKQDTLVSGTNIKTINSTSLLGSGDVAVQQTLVSGTNIKTLNSESLLGSGNIEITASPAGVAGAIQFSDGSAFASDAANLFWDDTNNRLGIGTNAPVYGLDVSQNISGNLFARFENTNAGGFGMLIRAGTGTSTYTLQWANYAGSSGGRIYPDGVIIGEQTAPSARLHVKGSGSTSATIALLMQNSAGTQLLRVRDDSQVQLGSSSNFTVDPNTTYNRFELAVGGLSSISSAILSATSTTRGFLPPRMTTTQKNAISSPASGLMVYDTDTNKLCCYNGTSWNDLF